MELNKSDITLTYKGQTLNETDFEIVEYTKFDTYSGNGEVVIRGLGVYGGLKKVSFKII